MSPGCPKNEVDAKVMLGILEAEGYRIVQDVEPAEEEAIDALLHMAELKQQGTLAMYSRR